MKLASLRLLSLVLALGAATACGGDDDLALDDLGPSLIDAVCDRAVRCGVYASVQACKDAAALDLDEVLRSVDAGRVDYDGEQAAACLDDLRDASCDRTTEGNRNGPEACDNVFAGTVPDGGACFNSEECISNECEVPDCGMACCTGACVAALPVPALGQACPDGVCADGAYCNAGTCAALLAAGASCTDSNECAYGLYCPEGGACADAPNRGDACPAGDCADVGDRCDATTTTCVGLSPRGGPCSEGFAGFFDCQQPLVCNETSLVCEDPPAIGQACTFFCATGAFCNDTSTCEAVRADGAMCTGDDECASRFCDDFLAVPVCATEPVCG